MAVCPHNPSSFLGMLQRGTWPGWHAGRGGCWLQSMGRFERCSGDAANGAASRG